MARYEHLPIYKKAMEMTVYVEEAVRHFSRYHKYGIGGDLRDISRQIIRLVIRANSTEQKTPVLKELVEACEQFKVMVVLAKEIKAFRASTAFSRPPDWRPVCVDRARGGSGAVKRARIIHHAPAWVDECADLHCAPPPPSYTRA